MLAKLIEILERKTIRNFLLAFSIIGFTVCIMLMQAQVIDFIINIVETRMVHRKLASLNKWKGYLFGTGYSLTVFFVIVWFFFMRKKFYVSLFFLIAMAGLYVYTYKIFTLDHEGHDLLRFPVITLLCVTFAYIVANRRYFDPLTNKLRGLKTYLSENNILNSSYFVFTCGILMGALFFIYIFGTAILDFTYTDWLMPGGDLTQHYTGWRFFRNSKWYFPIGLMDNIVYPYKVSIIYTDSIPLFAIIFKLLSPVLPGNFQYFGLFGILCYALQGGIGAMIVRKIGGNTYQSIIASIFFILSTVVIWRLYLHTALASHFIILLCILLCLQDNLDQTKQIFFWSCLLVLSALIHIYFVPMVMIFMFFYLLREYFVKKKLKNQCIVVCVSFLILIVTMFCFGAFIFVKYADMTMLGIPGFNLNSFFNPIGMSRFIKDAPVVASKVPADSFSYLGLGMILFIIIIIGDRMNRRTSLKAAFMSKTGFFPYIAGIVISFLLFSLSPTISFNQYVLFSYPVIWPVDQIFSIFRAPGRMIWPVIYIIITSCVWWVVSRFSCKKSVIFMFVLLLIQWVDVGHWFGSRGNDFKTITTWQTELASPVWIDLANDYDHIFFTEEYIKLNSFLDLAANHKMTVNDAYLSRTDQVRIDENKRREKEYLIDNGPRDDTVYVLQNKEQALFFKENAKGIYLFLIDDVFIGLNSNKLYLENHEF